MKRKRIPFLLCMMLLCGCSSSAQLSDTRNSYADCDLFAMDTYMYLKAYGDQAETALSAVSKQILELEETFSVTEEKSEVWAVNHAEGEKISVSDDTIKILETAIKLGNTTDGALDITLYPVLQAWGFTAESFQVPEEETLTELLEMVDFRQISVKGNQVTIPEGMMLDFGALAKGYTGDCAVEILKEYGIESGLLNLGGNVQALGTKPDGSAWKVAVKDPFSEEDELCILEIKDKAVITSGSYERYFTDEEGNRYWHILDAKDGYPADSGLVSVTIVGDSGILCDGLSTALFVMGKEEAVEFWRAEDGFEMILVTEEQELYYTQGLKETLQNCSSMKAEMIRNE